MSIFLLISFFINAFISAFVGLGGGTFYLLLLDFFQVDYLSIPFIALTCNICVSGIAFGMRLKQKQRVDFLFLLCILIPSMASTYLGGQIRLEEKSFRLFLSAAIFLILCFSLVSKAKIYWYKNEKKQNLSSHKINYFSSQKMIILCAISLGIGLLSGIIGIGGGIILGPILYLVGMSYLDIPIITAVYILLNSCVGLVSQIIKYSNTSGETFGNSELGNYFFQLVQTYWPLVLICILSGLLSMRFHNIFKREKIIKICVFFVIMSIAIYNLIRAGVEYV